MYTSCRSCRPWRVEYKSMLSDTTVRGQRGSRTSISAMPSDGTASCNTHVTICVGRAPKSFFGLGSDETVYVWISRRTRTGSVDKMTILLRLLSKYTTSTSGDVALGELASESYDVRCVMQCAYFIHIMRRVYAVILIVRSLDRGSVGGVHLNLIPSHLIVVWRTIISRVRVGPLQSWRSKPRLTHYNFLFPCVIELTGSTIHRSQTNTCSLDVSRSCFVFLNAPAKFSTQYDDIQTRIFFSGTNV